MGGGEGGGGCFIDNNSLGHVSGLTTSIHSSSWAGRPACRHLQIHNWPASHTKSRPLEEAPCPLFPLPSPPPPFLCQCIQNPSSACSLLRRSTVVSTFYAGVARSRSGSSSFIALAVNKPSFPFLRLQFTALALNKLLLLPPPPPPASTMDDDLRGLVGETVIRCRLGHGEAAGHILRPLILDVEALTPLVTHVVGKEGIDALPARHAD